MKQMKNIIIPIIMAIAAIGVCHADWVTLPHTTYNNGNEPTLWNYGFTVEHYKENGFVINGSPFNFAIRRIALPACTLPRGEYTTIFEYGYGGSSEGWTGSINDTINGPAGSLALSRSDYRLVPNFTLIEPRYVNTCNTAAPCTYPFPVRFRIEIPKPTVDTAILPNYSQGENPSGYSWSASPPVIDVEVYEGTNMITGTMIKKADAVKEDISGSFANNDNYSFEFELPENEFAVITLISAGTITYTYSVPHGDGTPDQYVTLSYSVTNGFKADIFYTVDNAPPVIVGEDALRVSGLTKDQNNGTYYTNAGSEGNPVRLEWDKVNDGGTSPNSVAGAGESTSGTAKYQIWDSPVDNEQEHPCVDEVEETGLAVYTSSAFILAEGEYTYYLSVKDKADRDSRYKYENDETRLPTYKLDPVTQLSIPDATYNSACHFIVDRSKPNAVPVSGFRLDNPNVIDGEDFARAANCTLVWEKTDDLPNDRPNSGIDKYTLTVTKAADPGQAVGPFDIPSTAAQTYSRYISLPGAGIYAARVRAYDKAGNEGDETTYTFYYDPQAPNPPPIDSLSIPNPQATAAPTADGVTFTVPKRDEGNTIEIALNLANLDLDGNEAWKSGTGSISVKQGGSDRGTYPVTGNTMTITFPPSGSSPFNWGNTYAYTLYSTDKAGNRSETGTNVTFDLSNLGKVTVTAEYDAAAKDYKIRWTPPVDADVPSYKAIIDKKPAAALADFAALGTVTPPVSYPGAEEEIIWVHILMEDMIGSRSITNAQISLPGSCGAVESEEVAADTTWSGAVEMTKTVIVPAGVTLTVNAGTTINVSPCTRLIVHGNLVVNGTDGARVVFSCGASPDATTAWQGITVFGNADIHWLTVKNAKRGLAVLNGAAATVDNGEFIRNRVGLHVYQSSLTVSGSVFDACEWYGVKEDAIGAVRPRFTGCTFTGNGNDYYHDKKRNLTMDALNDLAGNGGNHK